MRSYAAYLATMTVKALNVIARDMGLKGYSKLRKAALVAFIDDAVSALVPIILDTEVAADAPRIAEIMTQVDTRTASAETIRGWHTIALDMNAANYPDARNAIPELRNEYGVTEHSNTFGIGYGRVTKCVPVKVTSVEVEADETEELIFAYRAMRRTIRDMGNVPARISIVNRMRKLSTQLRAAKVDMRTV